MVDQSAVEGSEEDREFQETLAEFKQMFKEVGGGDLRVDKA